MNTHQEHLDHILDKICRYGTQSLIKDEFNFLDAFSVDDEIKMNKLNINYSHKMFVSDDELFTFYFCRRTKDKNGLYYHGILIVPDLKVSNKIVSGDLNGYIWDVDKHAIPMFEKDKFDVFDFCSGIEYELDVFLDNVIFKIKDENID